MKDRNESFLQMYFKLLGTAMNRAKWPPGDSNDVDLITALFASDRPRRLKIILGNSYRMEAMVASAAKKDRRHHRAKQKANTPCLKRRWPRARSMSESSTARHLSDMDKRLRTNFLQPASITWFTAWISL